MNESARIAALQALFVLDSAPEPVFDSIVRFAAQACGAPMAALTLIDADRQWLKACVGIEGVSQTPREESFCTHTILADAMLEVADATLDARFAHYPTVAGESGVRFYAGVPLILPNGERVGALCVVDARVRRLDEAQAATLRSMAEMAVNALLMRRDLLAQAISARSEYESALAASEAEYADLYANAPCGYHSIDANGVVVRMNDTELRWLGRTREEVIGKMHILEVLTPEGVEVFQRNFPLLKTAGRLDDIQFDLVAKDGTRRSVLGSATVIRDGDGNFLMTRTATFDITELCSVKAEHRKLTAERQAILDTDLVGVMKVRGGRIAWCNRGLETLFGVGPGELTGESVRQLLATDKAYDFIMRHGYPNLRVGEVCSTEIRMMRRNGTTIWVALRATATPDSPRDPICMIVDITSRKRAEELRLRAAELEAENRQLIETGRVNSLFLANMSHELYTPLNAIIGYAHVLQSGVYTADSPKFSRYLGQIGQSGQHLLELIRTMLNFADAESGKFALRPEPVVVADVARDVIDMFHLESRKKGISMSMAVDPAIGEVAVDERRLAQVVSLYLSNAIKFSPADSPVELRIRADGTDRFRIEVADRGIGIAPEDIPRLFVPFRQLNQGGTKPHGGAGLSLALAKRLARAQGGDVGVESRRGDGSVFWIALPRVPATS
ncbi:MAG: ATP-binding protein [Burkholderiaceae bacterium]